MRLLLIVGTLVYAPLAGQAAVFELLHGAWQGEGTLMGNDARFTAEWDVRGTYAVLRFENPFLTAAALYQTGTSTPEATWLDSRGVRIAIRWQATDSVLVAHWTAPSESGRTTYRIRGDGRLETVDEVNGASGWRVFARAVYRRGP